MFRFSSFAGIAFSALAEPVKLIIDTDIGGGGCQDVDDVVAVALGHAMMDNGEAELLAVVVNTDPAQCPGVVSVLNHYYGRDDIPIGSYKGDDLHPQPAHQYVADLVDGWESPIKDASQVPSSVEVYRKVLAAQPDHSVAISSIGVNTNLRDLLMSEGDEYSSLNGVDLVAQKVKLLASMSGAYPGGKECNMMGHWPESYGDASAAASAYVFSHWPASVKIIFSGVELGSQVQTAGPIYDCAPVSNPARLALIDYVGYGNTRPSWDPLTTVVAVRGAASMACSECTDCNGINSVDASTGHNTWVSGPPSNQTYLVLHDAQAAAAAMDELLCKPPNNPPPPIAAPTVAGMSQIQTGETSGSKSWSPSFGGGDFSSAWDGDVHSFFDSTSANGVWTQAELSTSSTVSHIEYWPRAGFLDRHVGGEFHGITSTGEHVSLATISATPSLGWNSVSVSTPDAMIAVQYVSPDGGFGNIAEIALYTSSAVVV